MSNDSNRDAGRSNSPGELEASDFFPPGVGWNKDAAATPELPDSPESPQEREARVRREGEIAIDGQRRH